MTTPTLYRKQYDGRIKEICDQYGCEKSQLFGTVRQREVVQARMELARHLRFVEKLSFVVIGQILGRDHATIMHYCGVTRRSAGVKWRKEGERHA